LIEIITEWNFQAPRTITTEDIKLVYNTLDEEFLSVSHFLSKKYYPYEKGYYVFGKTYLKIRTYESRVGSIAKKLIKLFINGTSPCSISIQEISPNSEGFIIANKELGELNYDEVLSHIEDCYFSLAERLYNGFYQKKLIPVITNYKSNLYRIQLFGDEKVIELFNIVGLNIFGKRLFFYHKEELGELEKLSNKIKEVLI